mgnify:CR=1 FL=1
MTSDSQSESGGVVSSTALLDRIKELDALIEPLDKERSELKQKLLASKSEILVGDIITWLNGTDRKSTRLNSSHSQQSRMPSSA